VRSGGCARFFGGEAVGGGDDAVQATGVRVMYMLTDPRLSYLPLMNETGKAVRKPGTLDCGSIATRGGGEGGMLSPCLHSTDLPVTPPPPALRAPPAPLGGRAVRGDRRQAE